MLFSLGPLIYLLFVADAQTVGRYYSPSPNYKLWVYIGEDKLMNIKLYCGSPFVTTSKLGPLTLSPTRRSGQYNIGPGHENFTAVFERVRSTCRKVEPVSGDFRTLTFTSGDYNEMTFEGKRVTLKRVGLVPQPGHYQYRYRGMTVNLLVKSTVWPYAEFAVDCENKKSSATFQLVADGFVKHPYVSYNFKKLRDSEDLDQFKKRVMQICKVRMVKNDFANIVFAAPWTIFSEFYGMRIAFEGVSHNGL
ncbi:hypothetical protein Pmar_PMAR025537 [Perkinsus marinus ATCC 50983]|uniref:Uncharacterized protein n=1 Tax=Perkinsus marinus (strain ATCC 50983 / TXsc) TaxID=423536 RepID=C5LZB9_PERM5|nr:hypothetical protein Pmar_PMAR025537 [Perkinsus marinus ATCC 50983]EEQ97913.1 hypothetical protein Pmar_PMAR025537 [Perkinsus marinus ATCC 50983]|eukprot:XP_002765196.1 hypothetical protein Pmar_PMAR025537 [Perkinsus marinus ATCC 50983]